MNQALFSTGVAQNPLVISKILSFGRSWNKLECLIAPSVQLSSSEVWVSALWPLGITSGISYELAFFEQWRKRVPLWLLRKWWKTWSHIKKAQRLDWPYLSPVVLIKQTLSGACSVIKAGAKEIIGNTTHWVLMLLFRSESSLLISFHWSK